MPTISEKIRKQEKSRMTESPLQSYRGKKSKWFLNEHVKGGHIFCRVIQDLHEQKENTRGWVGKIPYHTTETKYK